MQHVKRYRLSTQSNVDVRHQSSARTNLTLTGSIRSLDTLLQAPCRLLSVRNSSLFSMVHGRERQRDRRKVRRQTAAVDRIIHLQRLSLVLAALGPEMMQLARFYTQSMRAISTKQTLRLDALTMKAFYCRFCGTPLLSGATAIDRLEAEEENSGASDQTMNGAGISGDRSVVMRRTCMSCGCNRVVNTRNSIQEFVEDDSSSECRQY